MFLHVKVGEFRVSVLDSLEDLPVVIAEDSGGPFLLLWQGEGEDRAPLLLQNQQLVQKFFQQGIPRRLGYRLVELLKGVLS